MVVVARLVGRGAAPETQTPAFCRVTHRVMCAPCREAQYRRKGKCSWGVNTTIFNPQ